MSVVLAHIGPLPIFQKLLPSVTAVESFFIASGFVVCFLLYEVTPATVVFYRNRASRIFTGFWVALAFALLVEMSVGGNPFRQIWGQDWSWLSKVFMTLANLFLVGSDIAMFTAPTADGIRFTADFAATSPQFHSYLILPPAWTLPLELAFYAVAPFIVRSPGMLVALAAVSVGIRLLTISWFGQDDPWNYRFFPSEFLFFAAGALSYHLYRRVSAWPPAIAIGWLCIGATVLSIVVVGVLGPLMTPMTSGSKVIPFLVALPLVMPFMFLATKDIGWDRSLGDLTYMVYLAHWPIFWYMRDYAGNPPPVVVLAVVLIVAVPLNFIAGRFDRFVRSSSKRWLEKRVAGRP